MASLPGGPSIASICIRSGWTLGNVKDIYMRYLSAGDQFVGHCLAMIPLLKLEFGSSPPSFMAAWEEWANDYVTLHFATLRNLHHFRKLAKMCLSTLNYHRHFIVESFPINHVVRVTSSMLRSAAIMEMVDTNTVVVVTYPWLDSHGTDAFTGIPPHVAILQELQHVKQQQRDLIDNFITKVTQAIDDCGGLAVVHFQRNNCILFLKGSQQKFGNNLGSLNNVQMTLEEMMQSICSNLRQIDDSTGTTLAIDTNGFQRI
ncbi:hypothetical protein ACA910_011362 [Epithemia clementina (nom. ined.)]